MKRLAWFSAVLGAAFAATLSIAQVGGPLIGQAAGGDVVTSSTAFRAPDGTVTIPGYGFTSSTNLGFYKNAGGRLSWTASGVLGGTFTSTGVFAKASGTIGFAADDTETPASFDTVLTRDGSAGVIAQKNGSNAQTFRVYNTTSGPVHLGISARTAGGVLTATGGAMQLSTVQTTAPTCSASCGTSPSVAGTDTAMIVTMGGTGTPATPFTITFNGTWPAAPACHVSSALASMVVGKMAIAVVTSTTTIQVTTNGTAPGTSDKYSVICMGVS